MTITDIIFYLPELLGKILFYKIYGFPFLAIWLAFLAVFMSFYLKFPNFRLFKKGLKISLGKEPYEKDPIGEISPSKSLLTSLSSIVGMGTTAGVAVAIATGGAGALFWMFVLALFGMNSVFSEVVLAQKYRRKDSDGRVNGGAFQYIKNGFTEIGYPKIGKILSVIFIVCNIIGYLGSASTLSVNQIGSITESFPALASLKLPIVIAFLAFLFYSISGGAKKIISVIGKITPAMMLIYTVGILGVILTHIAKVPEAFGMIFRGAFGLDAVAGGVVGTIAMGVIRASYSTEAGLGSSAVGHTFSDVKEPVLEGSVSLLNIAVSQFISLTAGLAILVTGSNLIQGATGILMIKNTFNSVAPWFTYIFYVIIMLNMCFFMNSCVLSIHQMLKFLTAKKWPIIAINILFVSLGFSALFIGLGRAIDVADALLMSIAIPNVITVIALRKKVKEEYNKFLNKTK